MSRLGIFLLWLLHFLPLPALAPIGSALGMLIYHLVPRRRRIASVNVNLCFPELSQLERERLVRRHFRSFGRAIVDSGVAWWGTPRRLRRVVRLEGAEHIEGSAQQPVLALAPHFVGVELIGQRLAMQYRGASVYQRQKDRVLNAFLKRKRERFPGTRLFARQEGIKPILRALRDGQPVMLYPDMDLGPRDSVFVPFFGVPAATVTAVARICGVSGARVVPAVVRQLPAGRGYLARIYPPWDHYPSGSAERDARRMNAFIEERIREMPEQYLWTHRRFKTRPPGEPSRY
jgi:KDO2-lipid IV(A) lauroyltransferase